MTERRGGGKVQRRYFPPSRISTGTSIEMTKSRFPRRNQAKYRYAPALPNRNKVWGKWRFVKILFDTPVLYGVCLFHDASPKRPGLPLLWRFDAASGDDL